MTHPPLRSIKTFFLFLILLFASESAYAWDHEISIGYGDSKEIEQDYHNRGYVFSAKLYKFRPIDNTLIATIDGTLAHWQSSTDHDNKLTTVAIAPSLRAYFVNPNCSFVRPYLNMSFGPAYLSSRFFGEREQGAHFAFQSTLEVGTEIGNQKRSLDLNLHLVHYCNAGIFRPNQGIDVVYIFSVGYQF